MVETMKALLIILAIAIIAFAFFSFWTAYKKRNEEAKPARAADPFEEASGARPFGPNTLGPGAILSRGGTDYVVRGSLELTQGPYVWYEHMMDGGQGSEWLSVEVEEGVLELVLWRTISSASIDNPLSQVDIDGVHYKETERGHAAYTARGNAGVGASGRVQYVDYTAVGSAEAHKRLSYERFGDDAPWEISTGEVVRAGEFVVYPAPEQ